MEKYLLTAFLTLPVEEEVSISRQNTVHTTSTMSENQAISLKRSATATQLMHELRYIKPIDFLVTNICLTL